MYKHMEGVRNFICKCRSWLMFQGHPIPEQDQELIDSA